MPASTPCAVVPTLRDPIAPPCDPARVDSPGSREDRTSPCSCVPRRALKVMGHPGGIAFWCPDCGHCVPLDEAGLTESCLRDVRRFARQYGHIFGLWLESTEYESWAARELFRAGSSLNRLGRVVSWQVAATVPCYYALGTDPTAADETTQSPACPVCGRAPVPSGFMGEHRRLCRSCGLLLA